MGFSVSYDNGVRAPNYYLCRVLLHDTPFEHVIKIRDGAVARP